MNSLQIPKVVGIAPPKAISNGASVACASLDTQGYDIAKYTVYLGAMDAALAAFKLQESDTDGSYVDIAGADFSVAPLTLPVDTDDNHIFSIYVNCKAHKRWLKLVITTTAGVSGTYVIAHAELGRPFVTATTAAGRGNTQEAFV